MKNAPFSVAMAVYCKDNALFFDRALYSITEEQTLLPDEIVLVCDGPLTLELDAVVYKYQKLFSFLKVIRLEHNSGLGNALRVAVENSSNELIARMDSDDVSVKDRFEQQMCFFSDNPNVDILGGDITEYIGEETNTVSKRTVPKTDFEIKKNMKKRCAFNHMTVMFKKSAVEAAGSYQDWFYNEDYYLWLRMMLNGSVFANTGTVLVKARVDNNMYQRRGGKKYFLSEFALQQYMLKKNIINSFTFAKNVAVRFIIQLLVPNKIRGWLYRKYARE